MHDSIALALCRGQTRILQRKSAEHFKKHAGTLNGLRKRKPWLNRVLKIISEDPGTVVTDIQTLGTSIKSATVVVTILGLTLDRSEPWQIVQYRLTPRDFGILPVVSRLSLTWHVISRVMQRENIPHIRDVLLFMAPAINMAGALIDHPDKEVMIPCGKGGAFFIHWGVNPDEIGQRIARTYVDREKLAPDQLERMDEMWAFAQENSLRTVGSLS